MKLSKKQRNFVIGLIAAAFLGIWIIPKIQSVVYHNKIASDLANLGSSERIAALRDIELYENAARTTLAQIFGGIVIFIGLYFTYENSRIAQENLRVAEEGKLTDRFSKAVEMLGDEKLELRLGGIYALERIALDSKKDHWTVMEVLTAFVRENAPYNPDDGEKTESVGKVKPSEDIQAIMFIIGRRKWVESESRWLNLQNVNLAGCLLPYTDLNLVDMKGANLSGAVFLKAELKGASFQKANLICASFRKADLRSSNFENADMTGAIIAEADLRDSKFLTLEQILSTSNFKDAQLPQKLEEELKEWQTKQTKENTGADGDSSEDRAEE